MHIKNILFPQADICDCMDMYFRSDSYCIVQGSTCAMSRGSKLSFDTYFNSFSIEKWLKYTRIQSVSINIEFVGAFKVVLYNAYIINNTVISTVLSEHTVFSNNRASKSFNFESQQYRGILYFEITAVEDNSVFYGGYYYTEDSIIPDKVHIAIGICTFRREDYISHNVELFNHELITNSASKVFNNLDVFISDNGHTLDESLESEHIHLFMNKNTGGAGGFTRTLIEILNDNKDGKYTHVLLMDDDITINPESLSITYTFLSCLKTEYLDAFIGGQMLRSDLKYMQSEAADHFDTTNHHPVKFNYDLRQVNWLIKNEIEDSVNYFSWWYCCMPITTISYKNLPLPVFIKRDDIEYGLRNGTCFISINGICVWHEPFEYKTSAHLDYYYFRNLCILTSLHRPNIGRIAIIKELTKNVGRALYTYRYRNAEFCLWGIQDFLKGFDWLKNSDGEAINKALMKNNYKKVPVEDIEWTFQYGAFASKLNTKENKTKTVLRNLFVNGYLLPASKGGITSVYKPHPGSVFRKYRVLNYEDATKTAFITSKDYSSFFIIIAKYITTVWNFLLKYNYVKNEYRNRKGEITNVDFWEEYLNRQGEPIEYRSSLPIDGRPKNRIKQTLSVLWAYMLIWMQWLLFFIPVKKNRVMLYVHNRKGLTCNPKYIMIKLLERYGDGCDIYWVTNHPKSCENIPKNVKVVKSNSAEHIIKYLRTRVYITNDCFPSWAAHTAKHKWINVWHGAVNYKHIGYHYLEIMSPMRFRRFKLINRQPDKYVSASNQFTKDTSKSFKINEDRFVELGFPRNDIFFHDTYDIKRKLREHYQIKDELKVALYAPTFRKDMHSSYFGMDFDLLKASLKKRFGGEWVVLFRNHNLVSNRHTKVGVIDVTGYDDMNELLCLADVLISDYSSCMYDFSLQLKPCFVYAPDLNKYRNSDRDFAYPIDKWPYPLAESNEQLSRLILEFDNTKHIEALNKHFVDVGRIDDGNASERVVDIIDSYCKFDN